MPSQKPLKRIKQHPYQNCTIPQPFVYPIRTMDHTRFLILRQLQQQQQQQQQQLQVRLVPTMNKHNKKKKNNSNKNNR